jgi:hypothetical protein
MSTVTYDGTMGTGAGLCQLTVGKTSCWFNQTSRETVACAVWDAKKTTCLAAGPPGPRTAFAGAPSIVEMRSRTVQRQGQRMIPLFAAAIGVVYNLPSVPALVLSRDATNRIFLGEVSAWNHPLIQATNPGVALPARRIVRLVRSDNAAATQILVRALASFANTDNKWGTAAYWLQHPLRGSATPTWPTANTSAAAAGSAECVLAHCGRSICAVGQFFVPARDACEDCPPGTYTDTVGQPLVCTPCAAGHYGDAYGAAACSRCLPPCLPASPLSPSPPPTLPHYPSRFLPPRPLGAPLLHRPFPSHSHLPITPVAPLSPEHPPRASVVGRGRTSPWPGRRRVTSARPTRGASSSRWRCTCRTAGQPWSRPSRQRRAATSASASPASGSHSPHTAVPPTLPPTSPSRTPPRATAATPVARRRAAAGPPRALQ